MNPRQRGTHVWLWFGGLLVVLLLAGIFTLGSLKFPLDPAGRTEGLILFTVTTFIVSALIVFGLVLLRMLLRVWSERRAKQLGGRFKTKMVLGAMAISLLPVVFMFFISYGLLNRTLSRWFPASLERALDESQILVNQLSIRDHGQLVGFARHAALVAPGTATPDTAPTLLKQFEPGADAIIVLDAAGKPISFASNSPITSSLAGAAPVYDSQLPGGAEIWKSGPNYFLAGRAPLAGGMIVIMRLFPPDFLEQYQEVQDQRRAYDLQKQEYRVYKNQLLLTLSLFTLGLLFAATWFALFLSKQVTLPIQALADGTKQVTKGNLGFRVQVEAQDELGVLVNSFNEMTSQLSDSRRQIDDFTRSLQQALKEIENRRKLLETVLENIPTGVISLDAQGNVVRLNGAAIRMFGEAARTAHSLQEIAGEEAGSELQILLRRALRLGTMTQALELSLAGKVMHAAVTVSALGPHSSNLGYVIVVDDLTDLLRAQKLAAWQEVAQRIAHEIKNPLTPIQLSADRMARFLARRATDATPATSESALEQLVSECATSIGREVETLKSLVDEFSRYVRFPQARLTLADANFIVSQSLEVFRGRLDGITLSTDLSRELPAIKADAELLRGVLVNLIDNAAEALERSPAKELLVATRAASQGDALEIVIADTGCGISAEDKDKLFLPHFSTKNRGTGLGLAIAARIVAEHHGTLRVEDNSPVGSRFILRLPAAEVSATPLASEV
jgi:two-component system nitrogen regulation sensor histidine kinase NtrY